MGVRVRWRLISHEITRGDAVAINHNITPITATAHHRWACIFEAVGDPVGSIRIQHGEILHYKVLQTTFRMVSVL